MGPGMLDRDAVASFLARHKLPNSYSEQIAEHFLPLAEWIVERRGNQAALSVGINGAQGTGKSTLADFLKLAIEYQHKWRVAVVSIDDFYLTKLERGELAKAVHPLLATRGVPGTHDTRLLQDSIRRLRNLSNGEQLRLPRFDKAADDRAEESTWKTVSGPVDLIILEGWCVGSIAESAAALEAPVNALERDEDASAKWRGYANERLGQDYLPIFQQLDLLIFLKAPNFDSIYKWRLKQERNLAKTAPANSSGIMSAEEIVRFIQYYERITKSNLAQLPKVADVVIELDETQQVAGSHYSSLDCDNLSAQ